MAVVTATVSQDSQYSGIFSPPSSPSFQVLTHTTTNNTAGAVALTSANAPIVSVPGVRTSSDIFISPGSNANASTQSGVRVLIPSAGNIQLVTDGTVNVAVGAGGQLVFKLLVFN